MFRAIMLTVAIVSLVLATFGFDGPAVFAVFAVCTTLWVCED